MELIDNKGEPIGSLDVLMSNDKVLTLQRLRDVTTVIVRDRITSETTAQSFFGHSPLDK